MYGEWLLIVGDWFCDVTVKGNFYCTCFNFVLI